MSLLFTSKNEQAGQAHGPIIRMIIDLYDKYTHDIFSSACAIPAGDSVVLTGGMITTSYVVTAESRVSRYRIDQGWLEALPVLKVGRYLHGCTAFTKDDEEV